MKLRQVIVCGFVGTIATSNVSAQSDVPDFSCLSIEELMQVEITSVSRQEERWFDAAAAVTVITRDDIRRAGVLSIPEALRLAPGMDVAQIDANKWAVSSRGFVGRFSNKLLVLVDGRSAYTPFFGGVEWDTVDMSLDDIERIEVVRGPGASLWGSNAVNGVINIISRRADGADGATLGAVAGSGGGLVEVRASRHLAENMDVRLTALYRDRSASHSRTARPFADDAVATQAHLRWDWAPNEATEASFQFRYGDGVAGTSQSRFATAGLPAQSVEVDYDSRNVALHSWISHEFGRSNSFKLGAQVVDDSRDYGVIDYSSTTVDLEMESRSEFRAHEIIVGFGQRWIGDRVVDTNWMVFENGQAKHSITSGFAQDQFQLFHPDLNATVGVKFESNSYSSNQLEWQPNLRLRWSLSDRQRLWVSVARAIRTPSLIDNEGRFLVYSTQTPEGLPVEVWAHGSPGFHSERLDAAEVGYRFQPVVNVSIDVAAFDNRYRGLRGSEISEPILKTNPIRIETELELKNNVDQHLRGIEMEAKWDPSDRLRVAAGGSYTSSVEDVNRDNSTGANLVVQSEYHIIPRKLHIRTLFDISSSWQVDTALYYVSPLESFQIDAYTRIDARIGWLPTAGVDCSIGVQNLFEESHAEFGSWNWELAQEVHRNLYTRVSWRF